MPQVSKKMSKKFKKCQNRKARKQAINKNNLRKIIMMMKSVYHK